MTGPEQADAQARRRAVKDTGTTLFVEAGAGTGKTTMLVDRVVELITSGRARMDQIAAITFTEAAAAELRDRLAQKFEQLALEADDALAAAAVVALDAAAVTTLHGFARKILAEQPFSVGLPPLFDVADESSDRVDFDERWSRFVTTLLEDPRDEELVTRALSCGLTLDQLRGAALACHRHWDLLGLSPGGTSPAPAVEGAVLADLLEGAVALTGDCLDPDDKLAGALRGEKSAALAAVRAARDELDLLQILAGLKALSAGSGYGKRDNWPNGGKEAVGQRLQLAEAERLRLLGDTSRWVVEGLLGLLITFTREAADRRRSAGHLVFHDLLVLARDAVRDDATARAALHRRYPYLLIDEFQDTDPLQAELAQYLAADPEADFTQEWITLPTPPGRLFFVGDPKQSIYRFRQADMELFMKVRDHVVSQPLQLTANFRSRPAIVDWVNAVFAGFFGEGTPGVQPKYEALTATVGPGSPLPGVGTPVIVLGREPLDGPVDVVRAAQAGDVAAAIATMHAAQWPLGEASATLRYSDVAVLIRTRTGLHHLESALVEAGVPYRLESSSLVYQSSEVEQILAILRAIDDPADAVSVLAALRSPAFGCGDDDLFGHHARGGTWDWRRAGPDDTPVNRALVDLATMHAACWWKSVSAVVNDVVADRRLMALALSRTRPRESWRRTRFLLDQARLFDETHGGDLRAFLRWVGHQQEEEARVAEAIVPESDDDAVRVLTVHGAKGLEFPVVVLMGLQNKPDNRMAPLIFTPHGPEVRFNAHMQTPGYEDAADHEAEMARREQHRLLYVAATRAKNLLLVSAHRDGSSEATLAGELMAQCDLHPTLWSDGAALCTARPAVTSDPVDERADPDGPEQRTLFETSRTRLLTQMARPRTIAATGVRALMGLDDRGEGDQEPLEHGAMHRRGRAGTAVGRAVHAVLQVIDLESGERLDDLAHAQAVIEGVTDREREVRQRVRAALDSDVVRRAVGGGRYWREMYVGTPVGERVLEGFIDLLFETPEGLAIVDYKTDHLTHPDAAPEVAGRYRLQGASYAVAVEQALGQAVASCTYLFLTPSGAVPVGLEDLPAAVAEVRDILTRSAHDEPGVGAVLISSA